MKRRILSLVLALVMLLSLMPVTHAEETTVYMIKALNTITSPRAYVWRDGANNKVNWPGESMTRVEGQYYNGCEIYSYTFDAEQYPKIIFCNGDGTQQTIDLTVMPGQYFYWEVAKSADENYSGIWLDESELTDTTPPVATILSSSRAGDDAKNAQVNLIATEDAVVYYMVVDNIADAPTVEEVLAGSQRYYVYSGETDFTAVGLTTERQYVYFVLVDEAGNKSRLYDVEIPPHGQDGSYLVQVGTVWVNDNIKDDVLGDGTVSYDPNSNKLTLNDLILEDQITSEYEQGLNIELIGSNVVDEIYSSSYSYDESNSVISYYPLTITGEGSLTLSYIEGMPINAEDFILQYDGDGEAKIEYTTYVNEEYTIVNGPEAAENVFQSIFVDRHDGSGWRNLVYEGSVTFGKEPAVVTPYSVFVGDDTITSENASDVLGDGTVSYVPDSKTLTLNNATIVSETYPAIESYGDLTIHLVGNNTISSPDFGIAVLGSIEGSLGNLTITGTGSLTIDSPVAAILAKTITLEDGLQPSVGTITNVDENFLPIAAPTDESGQMIMNEGVPVPYVTLASQPVKYNLWVAFSQVTSENAHDVMGNGYITYNAATNTLTLKKALIMDGNHDGPYPYVPICSNGDLNLELIGDNFLHSTNPRTQLGAALYVNGKLNILGNGTLTADSSGNSTYAAKATIICENLTLADNLEIVTPENAQVGSMTGLYGFNTILDGTGNVALTAEIAQKQESTSYTITFDARGGEGTMDSVNVAPGASFELPGCGFTPPENKLFYGWRVVEDKLTCQPGDWIQVNSDLTVIAQWSDPITITYDLNDGTCTPGSVPEQQTVAKGSTVILPNLSSQEVTREGFDLLGWNTERDGSGYRYVNGDKIYPEQDITLYVEWNEHQHSYSFSRYDSDAQSHWQVCDRSVFGSCPTADHGKTNEEPHSFNAEGQCSVCDYQATVYTITFNANGGEGSMEAQTAASGTEVTLNACNFTNGDKVFTGWNTAQDGSGTDYEDAATIESLTDNLTLYAQWAPDHEHTFDELCYDGLYHWYEASCCDTDEISSKEAHSGGTATCEVKAVCAVCHQPYGGLGAHDMGTLISAQPEVHTTTELKPGVAAHYQCSVCEKYFDENKTATTLKALTGEMPEHSFDDAWEVDEHSHWKECICGLREQLGAHVYDNAQDADCNTCGYARAVYTVRVTMEGSGTASASPTSGIPGTVVNLTAQPAQGYLFKGWEVVSGGVTVADNTLTIGTQNVKVKAVFEKIVLTGIKITAQPDKTNYDAGESFDATGMVVTATYSDGTSRAVTDYDVSPATMTTATETVTVSYTEDGVTETASVDVHVHDYAAQWSSDDDGHWHECPCGAMTDQAEHTEETAATCEDLAKCDVCENYYGDPLGHDYARVPEKAPVHTESELSPGVAEHYYCDRCKGYFDMSKAPTNLDALTDETPVHSYGTDWESDISGHWHQCECGAQADFDAHTPGEEATCTLPQTCTECDFVITPAPGHEYGDWQTNESKHWKECSCGDKIDEGAHEYDDAHDADCNVCNYQRPVVSITVNTNGSSGSMDFGTVVADEPFSLPSCDAEAPAGKEFDAWMINGVRYAPGDTVTFTADTEVTALWKDILYTVTVTVSPDEQMGSASASATSGAAGTEITLTATANRGYQFQKWQVVSGDVTIENNTFTIAYADVEITAVFEEAEEEKVEVAPSTTPGGNVVISSGGGSGAASGEFFAGDRVTVQVEPKPGYTAKEIIVKDENGEIIPANDDGTYTVPEGGLKVEVVWKKTSSGSSSGTYWPIVDTEQPTMQGFDVICRKLNVRAGAGTQYKRIGSLARGAHIDGELLDNGWIKFKLDDGTDAYVCAQYVEKCDYTDETKLPEEATVVCRRLNVRAGAGTQYKRVGQLERGEKVRILSGNCGGWYKIAYNDGYAWISSKYVA